MSFQVGEIVRVIGGDSRTLGKLDGDVTVSVPNHSMPRIECGTLCIIIIDTVYEGRLRDRRMLMLDGTPACGIITPTGDIGWLFSDEIEHLGT